MDNKEPMRLASLRGKAASATEAGTTTTTARRKFAPKAAPRRSKSPVLKVEKIEKVDIKPRATSRSLKRPPRKQQPLASGKVAFMGNVNGELTSSSTLRTVSGNGISVSEGKMKLAEEMELEEMPAVWPPVIENVYTPLNIPFGNPVKLQDPNGNSDRVFYDEMGHSILSEESLLMVQLPTRLPFSDKTVNLSESAPSGCAGKLMIHASGKMVLKMGDVYFNVSAGINCNFVQEVCTVDTAEKTLERLGQIQNQLVVTPDYDTMLLSGQ